MIKIFQAHLLQAFVTNSQIDAIYALYPESFCNKNLAVRKVFAFSDSAALSLYVGKVCLVFVYGRLCLSTFSGSLREPIDPLLSRVTIVGHNGWDPGKQDFPQLDKWSCYRQTDSLFWHCLGHFCLCRNTSVKCIPDQTQRALQTMHVVNVWD